ncbi:MULTISPECIES: hypothetical protein [Frankia]|uniref:hypothetical protein n=1 Tax=Frankia TaxID=1854 RepID=UPI0002E4AAB2|nr:MULTISPECIES: hypothetical protein [Frankia]
MGALARLLPASAIHGPVPGRIGAGRDTPTDPLRILLAARTVAVASAARSSIRL